MSTKNLSRTVIEGGRRHYNSWERRESNAINRAKERDLSKKLLPLTDLDGVVYAGRPGVCRDFRDKLGPAARWLESQIGRPWNKVRGELVARFDARTTAGRHVLFDHMLAAVERPWPRAFLSSTTGFKVDRHGILKRAPRWSWV